MGKSAAIEPGTAEGEAVVLDATGRLVALAEVRAGRVAPAKVFPAS